MMEEIITLSGCINKEDHIWIREIKTKFLIADPRILSLNELSAKYQLFHLIVDNADEHNRTYPYVAERCIDGKIASVERISIIGEPTLETLIEWVRKYGGESVYKKEMSERHIERLIYKKNHKKEFEEKEYEVAFVWDD